MGLDELRTWTPADALRRSGAKPSKRKDRWTPCPLCGGADVWAGRVAWTCHHCRTSLDAVGTGRALSDGSIKGALEWAGLEDSVPGRYRVPDRPLVLDWTPVWLWPGGWRLADARPGVQWTAEQHAGWLWTLEPDLSIAARYAATGPAPHVRAARGLEAVAGREAVGMVWDALLDWGGGA